MAPRRPNSTRAAPTADAGDSPGIGAYRGGKRVLNNAMCRGVNAVARFALDVRDQPAPGM